MNQQPDPEKDIALDSDAPSAATLGASRRPRSARGYKARRQRFSFRASAAIATGRATGTALRRLRLGGGTSLPGLVARYIDPDLTRYLGKQLRYGSFVVTGTNGKT